jgi:EAL domain-containing protein (putative c-di-GMP-specific phosphodiesterase class I)
LRTDDIIAYLGDDEFAVLLLDLPPRLALAAADRLRTGVESYAYTAEIAWAMPTLSIGMLLVDGSVQAGEALALARSSFADDSRSGLIHYHSPASLTYSRETADWSRRVEDALTHDRLELAFQPVIEIVSGRVQHFDALLRLRAEDGAAVPAGTFLRHAENVGLIPRVDEWVVTRALALLAESPDLKLALNVSSMSLADPRFRAFIRRRQNDMAELGGRLLFEVPELIRDLAHAKDRMTWLQDAGCRFILDNFGITASALASLGALPIDYVKLDGRLIQGLASGEVKPELVQAIATIARAIDKRVIAGWAESAAVLDMLPALGVEYAQGYHIGRPTAELVTAGVQWAS